MISEHEYIDGQYDLLKAENARLRGRAERAERERDAALLGLGRVLSGADAARPPAGDLVAYAREFVGLDAAPAGDGEEA